MSKVEWNKTDYICEGNAIFIHSNNMLHRKRLQHVVQGENLVELLDGVPCVYDKCAKKGYWKRKKSSGTNCEC